jgi:predicted outer membrane repeat protein
VPGICGCTPQTTCPAPLNCDSIDNGCGTGTIDCGDCTGTDTCGGGTPPTPNVCGCTPTCPSNACGTTDDGCGSTISCNTCANPTPICVGGNPCAPCASSAQCGPHHLCRNGSCFACTVCDDPVACEASLQAAIDLAQTEATIYICPGAYNGTITIVKDVTLIGAGSGPGAGNTILDAMGEGRVVTVGSGHDVTLHSMRITGGSVSGGVGDGDGGGIYNTTASTLTMADCVVFDNSASRGGGIFNSDGALTLEDCEVLENTATGNGGGIYTELGSITLDASHVRGINSANLGGGIYSDGGSVTLLNNSSVTDNDAIAASPPPQGSGGGVFNSGGSVLIEAGSDVILNRPDNCIGC